MASSFLFSRRWRFENVTVGDGKTGSGKSKTAPSKGRKLTKPVMRYEWQDGSLNVGFVRSGG